MKALHSARSSDNLCQLTTSLKEWATETVHFIYEYTIEEVEAFLLPSEGLNKHFLMEGVANTYPFLFPELGGERQNRNAYLVRMFEAVAIGMRCLGEMENMKGRKLIANTDEEK